MEKRYAIALEISGPFGMFGDNLSGSETNSYPVPPISACQGMISAIMNRETVQIDVVAVATCKMPRWINYAYNSFSPHRKNNLIISNSALQIRESFLERPCFQVLALLRNKGKTTPVNYAHAMQEQYYRRLLKGQSFHVVSLGRKECLAHYFGVQRTPIECKYSTVLASMAQETLRGREIKRVIHNNVLIENGVLHFQGADENVVVKDGILKFQNSSLQAQIDFYTGSKV